MSDDSETGIRSYGKDITHRTIISCEHLENLILEITRIDLTSTVRPVFLQSKNTFTKFQT